MAKLRFPGRPGCRVGKKFTACYGNSEEVADHECHILEELKNRYIAFNEIFGSSSDEDDEFAGFTEKEIIEAKRLISKPDDICKKPIKKKIENGATAKTRFAGRGIRRTYKMCDNGLLVSSASDDHAPSKRSAIIAKKLINRARYRTNNKTSKSAEKFYKQRNDIQNANDTKMGLFEQPLIVEGKRPWKPSLKVQMKISQSRRKRGSASKVSENNKALIRTDISKYAEQIVSDNQPTTPAKLSPPAQQKSTSSLIKPAKLTFKTTMEKKLEAEEKKKAKDMANVDILLKDKMSAKIERILKSQWDDRLRKPGRVPWKTFSFKQDMYMWNSALKKTRTKDTSSAKNLVKRQRTSKQRHTKDIIKKARLHLNKRTLQKLRKSHCKVNANNNDDNDGSSCLTPDGEIDNVATEEDAGILTIGAVKKCAVCGQMRNDSQVKMFNSQLSCDNCRHFFSSFIMTPKQYFCDKQGQCMNGGNNNKTSCNACWLTICFNKFALMPSLIDLANKYAPQNSFNLPSQVDANQVSFSSLVQSEQPPENKLSVKPPTTPEKPKKKSRNGPRVKHVCRTASAVFGLPPATFPLQSESVHIDPVPIDLADFELSPPSPKPKPSPKAKFKRVRCGKCGPCQILNCGLCSPCKDMRIHGGPGVLKKGCVKKTCLNPSIKELNSNKIETKNEVEPHHGNEVKSFADDERITTDENHGDILMSLLCDTQQQPTTSSPTANVEMSLKTQDGGADMQTIPKKSHYNNVNKIRRKSLIKNFLSSKKNVNFVNESSSSSLNITDVVKKLSDNNVETPSRIISIRFWENYDRDLIWKQGFGIICSDKIPLSAPCFLCGSVGSDEMIYCVKCCEGFHIYCLDVDILPAANGNKMSWTCKYCQHCSICGLQENLVRCCGCHQSYHLKCLSNGFPALAAYKKNWLCHKCFKCNSCGIQISGRGSDERCKGSIRLCSSCNRLKQDGNCCPICQKCYSLNDYSTQMVQCMKCKCWIHSKCDHMTDDIYQILSILPDSVAYFCPSCSKGMPKQWLNEVNKYFCQHFLKILTFIAEICQSKSNHVASSNSENNPFSKQSCDNNELAPKMSSHDDRIFVWDSLQNFISSAPSSNCGDPAPDSSNCHGNLPNGFSDINKLSCLAPVVDKVLQGHFKSIEEFHYELILLLRSESLMHTMSANAFQLSQLFSTCFPWTFVANEKWFEDDVHLTCNEFHLLNQVQIQDRPSEHHDYSRVHPPQLHVDTTPILLNEKDRRICVLCTYCGDDSDNRRGRLLHAGMDDWIHINCALWSAEVYEEVDGSLQNVHVAIQRSRFLRCEKCRINGATVGCCKSQCPMNYHFFCARKDKALFQEDKKIYCHNHQDHGNSFMRVRSFKIDRCIHVDLTHMFHTKIKRNWVNGVQSNTVKVVAGSLTVINLGRLTDVSDCNGLLIPVDYCATRLFWSLENPGKKVHYVLKTVEVQGKRKKRKILKSDLKLKKAQKVNRLENDDNEAINTKTLSGDQKETEVPSDEIQNTDAKTENQIPQMPSGPIEEHPSVPSDKEDEKIDNLFTKISKLTSNKLNNLEDKFKVNGRIHHCNNLLSKTDLEFAKKLIDRMKTQSLFKKVNKSKLNSCKEYKMAANAYVVNRGNFNKVYECQICHQLCRYKCRMQKHIETHINNVVIKKDPSDDPIPTASTITQPSFSCSHVLPQQCMPSSVVLTTQTSLMPVQPAVTFVSGPVLQTPSYQIVQQQQSFATVQVPSIAPVQQMTVASLPMPGLMSVQQPAPPSPVIFQQNYQLAATPVHQQVGYLTTNNAVFPGVGMINCSVQPAITPKLMYAGSIDISNSMILPTMPTQVFNNVIPAPQPTNIFNNIATPAIVQVQNPTFNNCTANHAPEPPIAPVVMPPECNNNSQIEDVKPTIPEEKSNKPPDSCMLSIDSNATPESVEKSLKDKVEKLIGNSSQVDSFVEQLRNLPQLSHIFNKPKPAKRKTISPSLKRDNITYTFKNHKRTFTFPRKGNNCDTAKSKHGTSKNNLNHVFNSKKFHDNLKLLEDELSVSKFPEVDFTNKFIPAISQLRGLLTPPEVYIIPVSPCESDSLDGNQSVLEKEYIVSENQKSQLSMESGYVDDVMESYDASQTHIEYIIESDEGFFCQSPSIHACWRHLIEALLNSQNASVQPSYPTDYDGLKMFGLNHHSIIFFIEQLPGSHLCSKYSFKYHEPKLMIEDEILEESEFGCARAGTYDLRSKYDMFSFLASQHRKQLFILQQNTKPNNAKYKTSRRATSTDLPNAMRFRHLTETAREAVGVYRSSIHGRGLFCKRDIESGEMVIEYAGEVIRSVLTDKREKFYESKGIGCYMFRIDDYDVVDATMHGNAARFINHSCDPNCYSKVIQVDGTKHIVIFASRRIVRGEELTYNYKFPIEEVKIPCTCGSKKCRKYLN